MLSFILIAICACFFVGIINRTRSILSGRKGPAILQPMRNVWLLLRKGSVFSNTSSFVLRYAPTVALAATIVAAFMVPFGKYPSFISFDGDFVLFAYLLALSRFVMIIGAMDTGSSFEGMGASREALYAMLIEPALFILLGSFAIITNQTTFTSIVEHFQNGGLNGAIIGILAAFVLFAIMLVENSRMPIDDPKTHLELTMVHEVMILDHSGFDLGLIHLTTYLKFAVFGALIAACVTPVNTGIGLHLAIFFGVEIVCAIAVGFVESFRARHRLNKNPSFLVAITATALIAIITATVLSNNLFG